MKAHWFIHCEGAVLGPFTVAEVEAQIKASKFGADCLVWARGTNEWLPMSQWTTLSAKVEQSSKSVSQRVWYCDSGTGQPAGPLTQNELVEHLKGLNRWDIVTLWGTGLLKWLPLFDVPEVMDLVGISRRENPRAPLLGQASISAAGSSMIPQILTCSTISTGGLGVKNAGGLTRGDRVQIMVKSADLPTIIHAVGEVLYVSRTGEAGVKFVELPPESLAIIADLVRRFHDKIAAA